MDRVLGCYMFKLHIIRDIFKVILSWCSACQCQTWCTSTHLRYTGWIYFLQSVTVINFQHFSGASILVKHFLWKVRLLLKVSQIHCLIAWEILPPTAVHRKVISWCLELIMAPLLFSNVSTQRVINQSWKFHFNHWARWQTRAELEQEILLFLFRRPFNCSWQSGKRHDVLFSFYNSHFWLRLMGNSWVRSFALSRDPLFHPQ